MLRRLLHLPSTAARRVGSGKVAFGECLRAKTWASLDNSPTNLGPSLPWDSKQAGTNLPPTWAFGGKSPCVELGGLGIAKKLTCRLSNPVSISPLTSGRYVNIDPRNDLAWLSLDPNVSMSSWGSTRGRTTRNGKVFRGNFRRELLRQCLKARLSSKITKVTLDIIVPRKDKGTGTAVGMPRQNVQLLRT